MYNQKREFWWFTKRPGYMLYMLREGTAVLMFIYVIGVFAYSGTPNALTLWIGLIGAVGHTLSWLWLTILIPPFNLNLWQKIGGFLFLVAGWLALSYFILNYLYV